MMDGLCNTMLIQGPQRHGVGKTSLVYALANQLGYKLSLVSFDPVCFCVDKSIRLKGKLCDRKDKNKCKLIELFFEKS